MGLGGVSIRRRHATKPAMVKMNTTLVQAYDPKYVVQRQKNLGSRVALLPGKFLRFRKVFARITEKPFKLSQYFQNDQDFSR